MPTRWRASPPTARPGARGLAQIAPEVARGGRVLVVSHKNTLRAVARLLAHPGARDLHRLRVRTGVPLVFRFDPQAAHAWQQVQHP